MSVGPQRLWVSKSRARDAKGNWGIWHLVSNRPSAAHAAAQNSVVVLAVKKAFVTRNGGWVLRRLVLLRSNPLVPYVCLVCDGFTGHDESGEQALTYPKEQGQRTCSGESSPGAVAVVSWVW